MDENNERMQILKMIDLGKISASEGLRLLQALGNGEVSAPETPALPAQPSSAQPSPAQPAPVEARDQSVSGPSAAQIPSPSAGPASASTPVREAASLEGETFAASANAASANAGPADTRSSAKIAKWRSWWMVPLWIGVGITVTGGVLMYGAMQASGIGFWFLCAAVPFILGVVVIALAWQSRNAPWLHLRIQQRPGARPQKINLSFPLPLQTTAWFLRTFGSRIRGLQDTSLDEVILAVGKTTNPDNPLYIEVDEGEDGEKVEIYIG
jgi:hypothetical protein